LLQWRNPDLPEVNQADEQQKGQDDFTDKDSTDMNVGEGFI
jgi:hypothetical protein